MIKYKTQHGEEFQFENVDELLKYLDYKKYDVKMDEDFYPEFEQGDIVVCLGTRHPDGFPNVGRTFVVENIQIEDHGERMLVMDNGDAYNMDYYLFEKHTSTLYSYQQKTLDGNDKNVLKEAFDKIGVRYEESNNGSIDTLSLVHLEVGNSAFEGADIDFDFRNIDGKFKYVEVL